MKGQIALFASVTFALGLFAPSPLQVPFLSSSVSKSTEVDVLINRTAAVASNASAPSGDGTDGLVVLGPSSSSSPPDGQGEERINPIYVRLLEEAERLTELDGFDTLHKKGDHGIVIGPVGGAFRNTIAALRAARRIRHALPADKRDRGDALLRLALVAEQSHIDKLARCYLKKGAEGIGTACSMWLDGGGSAPLFDDVLPAPVPPSMKADTTRDEQGSADYWMTAMSGYLHAPYRETLFLDTDAYVCPGFQKLFALAHPYSQKLWNSRTTEPPQLVMGLEQFSHGPGPSFFQRNRTDPGPLPYFLKHFTWRNTGTVLLNFGGPKGKLVHVFARFVILVGEHVLNNVASPSNRVANDQTPFNLALYLFVRLRPDFVEQTFPTHAVCRTYPKREYAGIDGARNGMYPPKSDDGGDHGSGSDGDGGQICSECSCTPCLINHNKLHLITIGGKKGWEDEAVPGGGAGLGNSRYDGLVEYM